MAGRAVRWLALPEVSARPRFGHAGSLACFVRAAGGLVAGGDGAGVVDDPL